MNGVGQTAGSFPLRGTALLMVDPGTARLRASTAVTLALAAVTTAGAQAGTMDGIEWVRVPAGTFQMGCVPGDSQCNVDEEPRHVVTLTRSFDLMATEVTVAMYRQVAAHVEEQPEWSTPAHPMVIVPWEEARSFCQAIGGRLPTEAEWEYAARGGRDGTLYPWGDEPPSSTAGAAAGAAFESDRAQPARSYGPNAYGLFDMAGNVWEWTADSGSIYPYDPVTDPEGPDTSTFRIARGGSFGDGADSLRLSNRTTNRSDRANVNVGFRCARDVAP